MLSKIGKTLAAAVIALGAGTAVANADSCSGHNHTTGTVLGAVGGGLIGGAIGHGIAPVVGGAVVGGLAGNAISRGMDCHHRYSRNYRHRYYSEREHRYYYR
jgi:uncharacterized protein YcfJ